MNIRFFLLLLLCLLCKEGTCGSNTDSLKLAKINQEMMECLQVLNDRMDFTSDVYLKKTKKTAEKLNYLASQYEQLTNDSTVRACSFLGEVLLSMVYHSRENIDSAYVHAQSALSLYHPYGKYICEADSSKSFYKIVFGCDGLIGIEREMCVKQSDINKALYYSHIIDDSCSFYQFDLERVQSYTRQGELYEQINDYENAINSHIKALDLRLKHPYPTDYPLYSQVYNSLLEVISRLYSKQKLLRDNEILKQKFEVISNFIDWNEFFKRHPLDFCEEEENAGQTFWICALYNTSIRLLQDFKLYDTIFSIEAGLDNFYTRNFGKESLEYAEFLINYKNVYLNYSENELDSDVEKKQNKKKAEEKENLAVKIWNKYFEQNSIDDLVLKYQTQADNVPENKGRLHKILSSYTLYQTITYISSMKSGNYDAANEAIKKCIYIEENVFKTTSNVDSYLKVGDVSLFKQDFVTAEEYYNKASSLAYEQQDTIEMAETNLRLFKLYEITSKKNDFKTKRILHDAYDLITRYSFHSIQKSEILEEMAFVYNRIYNYETAYRLILLSNSEKQLCGRKLTDEDYLREAELMSSFMSLDNDTALFKRISEVAAQEAYTLNVLKASKLLGTYYVVKIKDFEKGAFYYKRAAKVAHELKDSVEESYNIAEIGTIQFAQKKYNEALLYMDKAQKINSQLKYRELLSLMAYIKNDSIVRVRLPYLYESTTAELKRNLLSTNDKGREWMVGLMPYDVFKSMPYYYPNQDICSDIAYNATLLYKGLLLNTQKSISEFVFNSNDKLLKEQYHALQVINNIIINATESTLEFETRNNIEAAKLELSILERLSKMGFMSNMDLTWQKVCKKLGNKDVAIEFVEINNLEPLDRSAFCYAALILRKGFKHPVFVKLGTKKEIDNNIDVLLHSFNAGSRLSISRWNTVSGNLYKEIWGQLSDYINFGDNVYFSAAGKLHQAPMEVLNDSNGVLANEKFNLYRVSSTRELCKKEKRSLKSVTLYGGLRYDNNEESQQYRTNSDVIGIPSDSTNRAGWDFLPSTLVEIKLIASKLDSLNIPYTIYDGEKGTEDSFRNLSGKDVSILHIATHGFFFNEKELYMQDYYTNSFQNVDYINPMKRTGLMMSGGQSAWLGTKKFDQKDDGVLLADEIASLDLSHTNLVVLSACQTGLGDIDERGEGVWGIQRALKLSGVKSIVLTLGKVDDKATQLFMNCFYNKLVANNDVNRAFLDAQYFVRNYEYEVNGVKMNYKNPRFWAPFILLDAIN